MRRASLIALSLFACTSTEPEKRANPAPVADTPQPTPPTPATPATPPTSPTAPTPPTPPTPPTAPAPPTPPAVATGEPATPWWCACYMRKLDGGGEEPITACRGNKAECLALERTIANGTGAGIVPQSVTHACREFSAAHPGDVLGTRDVWTPSKKPGAWLSAGACRISGEPNPDDATPPDDLDEQLGDFKWGTKSEDVLARLGEPIKKGRIELEGATGNYIQFWTYPDGLTFSMASDTRKAEKQRVNTITIKPPSLLKTKKGVGLGATRAEILKHYGNRRAPETEPDDRETFVAGSIYGGVFFTFDKKGEKVVEIFLGAGAE